MFFEAEGSTSSSAVFICTHRDADHMRGVNRIHRAVSINAVWDCGLPGGNPSSPECAEYMRMRRAVPNAVLTGGTSAVYGATRIRILSAADEGLPDDCNAQSIVIKVEHVGNPLGSVMLTGDSNARTWERILQRHRPGELASEILLGSHHGSWTFFDVGRDGYYYPDHIQAINPAMTVLSVGSNVHGHPDPLAVQMYERHSRGSKQGHRVWRTDREGTILLELHDRYGWTITPNQRVPIPPPVRKPQPSVTPPYMTPGFLAALLDGDRQPGAYWRALLNENPYSPWPTGLPPSAAVQARALRSAPRTLSDIIGQYDADFWRKR